MSPGRPASEMLLFIGVDGDNLGSLFSVVVDEDMSVDQRGHGSCDDRVDSEAGFGVDDEFDGETQDVFLGCVECDNHEYHDIGVEQAPFTHGIQNNQESFAVFETELSLVEKHADKHEEQFEVRPDT